jgi:serine/threonine protein kinase
LEYTEYNSFLLIYPKSTVSKTQVLNIFETWNISYDCIEFEIKSHRFYHELYNLEEHLSLNKTKQCGVGKANLFIFKTPLDMYRLRPTFSELKLCNIFAFDLKHVLRSVDGKNLVHGSTDDKEYSDDLHYILRYIKAGDNYVLSKWWRETIADAITLLKQVKHKTLGRLIYSYQKSCGYMSYLKFTILCFFNQEKKMTPYLLSKWRWASKYFLLEADGQYFIKVPNRFEDIDKEKDVCEILQATGCVEKCEVFECFGFRAIKKKWINIRPIELDEFYNPAVTKKLVKLFGEMSSLNVHHADIKYDNLQYEIETGRIILIDFGLSRSFEASSDFKENIREFDIRRWNDGWNLLDSIVQKDPLRLINSVDAYLAYSNLAGKYAACEDRLTLAHL